MCQLTREKNSKIYSIVLRVRMLKKSKKNIDTKIKRGEGGYSSIEGCFFAFSYLWSNLRSFSVVYGHKHVLIPMQHKTALKTGFSQLATLSKLD